MNNKINSIPLKPLLVTLLNSRLIQLEKTTIAEMKQIKDFTSQLKTMNLIITNLHSKSATLSSSANKTINKPSPFANNIKDKATSSLKHNKSLKKKVKRDNHFDLKNKPEPRRPRAFTAKKKSIKKKDVDFDEIVKMHMINFDHIEDDFSQLNGNTTIPNDIMNINISLIDNDLDIFTNDFDKNEEEVIKNLSHVKCFFKHK